MKKILITGASSHVAKNIIDELNNKYHLTLTYNKNIIKKKNTRSTKLDFKKKNVISDNFTYLINLASATPYKTKRQKDFNKINVVGFKQFLCNFKKTKKIFLLSGISIYGSVSNSVLNENYKPHKPDSYGISKIKMEKILIKHCKKYGIKYLILRSPAVIDKNLNHDNFINNLVKSIKYKKKFSIHSMNKLFNNLTSPEIISNIVKKFLRHESLNNQIFNLGSEKPIKIFKLINYLEKKYKTKAVYKITKNKPNFIISNKKLNKFGIKPLNTMKIIESFK